DEITGTFNATEKEIVDKKATFGTDIIKGKKQLSALVGAKVGDVVTLKTKGMFKEDHDNEKHLGVAHEEEITSNAEFESQIAKSLADAKALIVTL
ncbi:hypothetical protein N8252_04955, partial [Ulvibacter sp.]|nr:hypothetical protein [Ulvibacter sp.]